MVSCLFYILLVLKMKCLLCSLEFNTDEELFEHYVSFHKVDKSNWFFKKLFGKKIQTF